MRLLIPHNENLVTYYILPMVNVNKTTFSRLFKGSYLAEDGQRVYVELSKRMESPVYRVSDYYLAEYDMYGSIIIAFGIPLNRKADVELFNQGLYSKMSRETKKIIYMGSSLPYNEKMEDFAMTHPILHALCKTNKLREWLYTYLDVKTVADSDEIIDSPDQSWYIESRIAVLKERHEKRTKA